MTDLQHKALRHLWGRIPRQDIAELFGVPVPELVRHARATGLAKEMKAKHEWTVREEQRAWEWYTQGRSIKEIARSVHCTESAVNSKLFELRTRRQAAG